MSCLQMEPEENNGHGKASYLTSQHSQLFTSCSGKKPNLAEPSPQLHLRKTPTENGKKVRKTQIVVEGSLSVWTR